MMKENQHMPPDSTEGSHNPQPQSGLAKRKTTYVAIMVVLGLLLIASLGIPGYLVYKNNRLREQVSQKLISLPTISITPPPTIISGVPTTESLGIRPEDAARVGPIETITLTANTISVGILLQWSTERKSPDNRFNYFNIYRKAQGNGVEKKERINRIRVKQNYRGPYEYTDKDVVAGNRYVYNVVPTLVSEKHLGLDISVFRGTEVGLSNVVEITFQPTTKN